MKHKTHFLQGLKALIAAVIIALFLPTMFVSASRLGGNLDAYEANQEEVKKAEEAKKTAEEEAAKAEQELLNAILKSVEADEELTEVEKEKYEAWEKLEEERKKAEEAAKADEEKLKAEKTAYEHKQKVIKAYDDAENKESHYNALSEEDKKIVDGALNYRETQAKNKVDKESAIAKIEAAGHTFEGIESKELKEAMDTVEALTEDEIKQLELIHNNLVKEEEEKAAEETAADEATADAEALYDEALQKVKDAQALASGLESGDSLLCNPIKEDLPRLICKLGQDETQYANEAKIDFVPEECLYHGHPDEPNPAYDRCVDKYVKINDCWSAPLGQQPACIQKALGLPDKLVPVAEYCKEATTEDCQVRYEFGIVHFVATNKFLPVAKQMEEWYFNGQFGEGEEAMAKAAASIEGVMRAMKAFYWEESKEGKRAQLESLKMIWEDTKEGLIEKKVEEFKEEDAAILEIAKKKLEEGTPLEELSKEEQDVINDDLLLRKALAVEQFKLNEEQGKDGYDGLTPEQKKLVDEAFEEQSSEEEAKEDSAEQ